MIATRIVMVTAAAAVLALACRPREGGHCVCYGECAGGLKCTQSGRVLEKGECVNTRLDPTPGECTPVDDLEGDGGQAKFDVSFRYDVGGNRDFVYVPDPASTGTSAGTSTGASGSTDTAATTGGSSSSGASGSSSDGASSSSTAGG